MNFVGLLRAGHGDYVVNEAALGYMRGRHLSGPVIALLAEHKSKRFADQAAWTAHLESLGIAALKVHPDPARIATEGALWGSVAGHGLLRDTVIVSDDAGQFNIGHHALCWGHAERLIHKLIGFKFGLSFWDYLGDRLELPGAPAVPLLPDLIRQNAPSA